MMPHKNRQVAISVPHLCSQVTAMNIDQGLTDNHAQPDIEGTGVFVDVMSNAFRSVDIRLLQNVFGHTPLCVPKIEAT